MIAAISEFIAPLGCKVDMTRDEIFCVSNCCGLLLLVLDFVWGASLFCPLRLPAANSTNLPVIRLVPAVPYANTHRGTVHRAVDVPQLCRSLRLGSLNSLGAALVALASRPMIQPVDAEPSRGKGSSFLCMHAPTTPPDTHPSLRRSVSTDGVDGSPCMGGPR
jgi:hypothetical protein